MINITLPDGTVRQYEKGTTALQVALSISEGLARNVLSAKVKLSKTPNPTFEVWDATRPINEDANLILLTMNDAEGKSTLWHSSAHLMAEALESVYPGTKFGIGPAIENGFYYDIDLGGKAFAQEDFKKIEDKMLELARQNNAYVRTEVSKADAISYFKEKEDEYKLDLLGNLADGTITF